MVSGLRPRYLQHRPGGALAPFVDLLWTSERAGSLPHAREWNLPTGQADLVVPLHGVAPRRYAGTADAQGQAYAQGVLQGVRDAAALRGTRGACIVVGVSFRPAGLRGFWAMPAHELATQAWSLDDLWPGFAAELQQSVHDAGALHAPALRLQCLEAALRRRLRRVDAEPGIDWAVAQLAAGAAVGAVQRASGWSPASFVERYRQSVGLTPKRHARVLRLQAALQAMPGAASLVQLALDAGYADQAHFSREFRRLAGMTPRSYRAGATGFVHHVAWR